MNHPLIDDFIKSLRKEMNDLPANEQDEILQEINDHICTEVEEKKFEGKEELKAITETIQNFDKRHFNLLNEQYKNNRESSFEGDRDYGFDMTLAAAVGSLGALSIPILRGSFNLGSMLPWILFLISGHFVLFIYFSRRMNQYRTKTLQKTSKILVPLLAVPFAMYTINLTTNGVISYFSTIYLMIHVFVIFIIYVAFRSLYHKHKDMLKS
ncbi:HAAS signaling domain-containing protein [Caldalkalibacillus salinus]|uniref:HAAS signaling domain-containing protein n=1 Tax=Caldalkalibacillus salinus TaxID=2803787 RepID=UPI001921E8C3|nr:hypothetical protein [Caldalkalibacillus salinus]